MKFLHKNTYNNITLNGLQIAHYITCGYDPETHTSYFEFSLTKSLFGLQSFAHLLVQLDNEMRELNINHTILSDPACKEFLDKVNDTSHKNLFLPTYFEMINLQEMEGIQTYQTYLDNQYFDNPFMTINFEKINPDNSSGWASILYQNLTLQEDFSSSLYIEEGLENFKAFIDSIL